MKYIVGDKLLRYATTWCDDDIRTNLEDKGIEPTEENVNKVLTDDFIRGFNDLMAERGNEIIAQQIDEVFGL